MGTPARLPRALRRAQLLETATRQFTRSGYHRTSMDSIATAAGVTKPVLYQHFGSKEDLYLEVVRAVGARLITEIDQITDLEGGTWSRIAYGLHFFTTVLVESGTALRMLEACGASRPARPLALRAGPSPRRSRTTCARRRPRTPSRSRTPI